MEAELTRQMEAELTRKMKAELNRQIHFFICSWGSNSQLKKTSKKSRIHGVDISS